MRVIDVIFMRKWIAAFGFQEAGLGPTDLAGSLQRYEIMRS